MKLSNQVPDERINWPENHSPKSAVVFAHNSIEIAASPEKVWSLLIDCVRWPIWYKHCTNVTILQGGPLLGPASQFRFKTMQLYFEPKIEVFERPTRLLWTAQGPAGSSGAHAWYIESTLEGCRVITEEAQKGLILNLVKSRTQRTLFEAHEDWLQSLKALAEAA